jgi:hypothetical protein
MFLDNPVDWVRSLPQLDDEEKEAILVENPGRMLGL